ILFLIESGVPADRICAITFTNKAAREMANRIGGGQGAFIGTFHALGARILRKDAYNFGREANFAIFDDHDSFDLLKKIVKKYLAEGKIGKKDTPAFFAGKISELKNLDRQAGKSTEEIVVEVARDYEEALRRNNAFDFDDLIEKPVTL